MAATPRFTPTPRTMLPRSQFSLKVVLNRLELEPALLSTTFLYMCRVWQAWVHMHHSKLWC